MTIHTTPLYGIAYCDVDTPLLDIAQATQQAAETTDAALSRGGVVPPAAADLNAVTARVVALEGKPLVALTIASGWANFDPVNGTLKAWTTGKTGFATGLIKNTAALGAGASSLIATLPAGYRPVESTITPTYKQGDTMARIDVATDGSVTLVGTAAVGANTYFAVDAVWRLA